jgi:signal transduction histidine kinase
VTLGLGGLAALLLAAAAGAWLARSFTQPLADLNAIAARLGGGDLTARVDDAGGPVELRELAATFDHMAARLQSLVESQNAFVADASHELRTPLTALRLRLENLEPFVDESAGDELGAVIREAARLGHLVDGLLTIARMRRGDHRCEAVDVRAVVAERQGLWAALADEEGVSIPIVQDAIPAAWALPGAVEQILDNLIANALSVSSPGQAVHLRTAASNGWVELHVIDQGPGLSVHERERAFDRFWRHPSAPPGTGSGLGLAIVRQLAEAGGGQALLLPAAGGGVDATIRLRPVTRP